MTAPAETLRVFLGPVQPFIAAGRRTRDLWAGSFLLSRLAGEAMQAIRAQGGRITLPKLDRPLTSPDPGPEPLAEETLSAIAEAWRRRAEGGGADNGLFHYDPRAVPHGPMTGTLVNQFRAEVPAADGASGRPRFDPELCRRAVHGCFARLAEAVRQVFIEPAIRIAERGGIYRDTDNAIKSSKATEIRARWAAQTAGDFFELLWVRGGSEVPWPKESGWLGRRKTWRNHLPPVADIGADRCPLHPEMAELGGFSRVHGGGEARVKQETFWQSLRYVVVRRMYEAGDQPDDWAGFPDRWPPEGAEGGPRSDFPYTLELRPGERLSGFALVKRLFPLLSVRRLVETIGWLPDIHYSIGNPSPGISAEDARLALRNYPSTAFVAAIPWIVEVGREQPDAASRYAWRQWRRLGFDRLVRAERPQHHRIPRIDRLPPETDASGRTVIPLFAVLDGTLHFPRGLDARRLVERRYARDRQRDRQAERQSLADARAIAEDLQANYKALLGAVDTDPRLGRSARPSPFYAFLEMDGDSMGKMFSDDRRTAEITSLALLDFATAARELVRDCDGVPVYAGADDVLALLPVEQAIACASAIRDAWTASFSSAFGGDDPGTTVSASIVFADYQVPLNDVRQTAHQRLDRVAKDENGRDSIALAVMKSGGVTAEWVTTWTRDPASPRQTEVLWSLATDARVTAGLANGMAHHIAETFEPILDGGSFAEDELLALIRKELVDSGASRGTDAAAKEALAQTIVDLLAGYRRDSTDGDPQRFRMTRRDKADVEALLLARFLRQSALRPYLRTVGRLNQPGPGP
jgi:CRISPR-associated protein Cmr2